MKACAPFISALCLLLIQGVNCGFCPATSCLRTGASGQCLLPNISSSFCPASEWSPYITSYPPSWWTKSNISSMNATPALGYIKEYAPCCRHCVWSLGYPLAVPLVIVISPNQDLCAAEVSKFSLCYLDCTKWAGDLSVLDTDGNGRLSYQEFLPYFTDYLVAPSQNYQLYTGGRMTFDVQFSRLNPFYVFAFIDFNNDFMVSMQEWDIFRHFWTPVLVSGAGPSLVPSDGRSLAQGPFGGFFMDEALYAIWSTNAINLMLEYYVNHRKQGFRSYDVREPESVEKMSSMSSRDLDGSGRVSMEEHYFYHFSDKNGDGVLSPEEFYSSLYRTDCKPLCPVVGCNCSECPASGVVAADCPPSPQGDVDGTDLKRNFNLHDMDKNGVISFLERKFVAADLNMDRMIDSEEWRIADYPEDYGPFLGHCVVEGSRCVINSATYNFYMSFHYCASRGSKTYKRLLSQYPWSSSCLLKVEVERLPPFVDVIQFNTSDQKAKLESEGWLCWDPDPAVSNDSLCFTGYAVQMFHAAAERLLWTYRFVLSPSSLTVAQLRPPVVEGVGAGNAEFKLALFSSYKMPWRPPQYNTSDFFCSSTLWKQDGLVVVKRSDEKVVSIEFAILMLLISPSFINFIVFCYFVMLVVGHIFWWVERRQNPDLFNKSYVYGVMDGLWFSIVTVTSVGYGDKAPRTGLGKNLTVIWMFLGMLCYGVFSSGVSEQINVAAKENSIKSVYDLSTFQVGVLESMSEPLVKGIDLGLDYSFTTIKCKDLAECEKFLLTDQTISAFVAAHSDVIAYFQSRGLNDQMCGNPMRIVGSNFSSISSSRWTSDLIKACSYSNSVYAAHYLADALSATMQELFDDGTSSLLATKFLTQDQPLLNADGCSSGTRFQVKLIIATIVALVVYFALIVAVGIRRKAEQNKRIRELLEQAIARRRGDHDVDANAAALKYGKRWVNKVREKKRMVKEEKRQELIKQCMHDQIISIIKQLRNELHLQIALTDCIYCNFKRVHTFVSRITSIYRITVGTLGAILFVLTVALLVLWSKTVTLKHV